MNKIYTLIVSMFSFGNKMKARVVFALVLLQLAVTTQTARAQYSDYYYHRVGDTIEWKAENGYYSWWEWKDLYDHLLPAFITDRSPSSWAPALSPVADSGIVLERFYTPTPLKIIGIAGVAHRGIYEQLGMGIPLSWVSDTDTCTRKDYFLIYDAIGDSFPLVAQTEWSPYDTMRTLHIMFHMKQVSTVYDTTCCGLNQREDIFFPLKEYYFDNPVYVDDSFYVGGTYFGGIENSNAPNTHYPGSVFSGRAFSCDGEFQQDFPHPVYPGVTNGCVPVGMPML